MTPRYIIFSYNEFYPRGGWNDYISSHQTLDEAKSAPKGRCDFWQIVDLAEGIVVEEGETQ